MRIIEKVIHADGRSDEFEIYPLGDTHIGAHGCAEKLLRKHVKGIADNPNAYAIGGGDIGDLILPMDNKRFDFDSLPDWMLEGDAITTRERLNDILKQQLDRIDDILNPIPSERWLGAISGNHEASIAKYYNSAIHKAICNRLDIQDLSDEAIVRLKFVRGKGFKTSAVIILYIRHGYGGGRTRGAEANKIGAMIDEWEIADICFTGHTHTFRIEPPKPVLEIPRQGKVPKECTCRYRWGANWGCWQLSHPSGPGSYASRACYPARPMLAVKAVIKPFHCTYVKGKTIETPHVELRQITL